MGIAQRRGQALIVIGLGALHAVYRIVQDGVLFAEVVKQRGDRRQFAADGGRRKRSGFQLLAPGDEMRTGHAAEFFRAGDPDETGEVLHVLLVGATGFLVADVGKPLQLGRHFGQATEFGGGQGTGSRPGRFGQRRQRRLIEGPARQG